MSVDFDFVLVSWCWFSIFDEGEMVGLGDYRTDGVGLAAPQVGVNVQLMVFNPAGEKGQGEEVVLVNPKVFKSSQKVVLFEEGCLSFPEIYADVKVFKN